MLENLLRFIQKNADRLNNGLKEDQIRQFIDEIMRVLGWSVNERTVEPTLNGKEPDYVFTQKQKPVLIVEVKCPDRLNLKSLTQLKKFDEFLDNLKYKRDRDEIQKAYYDYAIKTSCPWLIVTNGILWCLINVEKGNIEAFVNDIRGIFTTQFPLALLSELWKMSNENLVTNVQDVKQNIHLIFSTIKRALNEDADLTLEIQFERIYKLLIVLLSKEEHESSRGTIYTIYDKVERLLKDPRYRERPELQAQCWTLCEKVLEFYSHTNNFGIVNTNLKILYHLRLLDPLIPVHLLLSEVIFPRSKSIEFKVNARDSPIGLLNLSDFSNTDYFGLIVELDIEQGYTREPFTGFDVGESLLVWAQNFVKSDTHNADRLITEFNVFIRTIERWLRKSVESNSKHAYKKSNELIKEIQRISTLIAKKDSIDKWLKKRWYSVFNEASKTTLKASVYAAEQASTKDMANFALYTSSSVFANLEYFIPRYSGKQLPEQIKGEISTLFAIALEAITTSMLRFGPLNNPEFDLHHITDICIRLNLWDQLNRAFDWDGGQLPSSIRNYFKKERDTR